ncbi:MAG: hypothetical protein JWO86_610 [Myxococcaceae bacterium]|nr:hypothetical protein [Myxococcaceae bacterium]
MEDAASALVAGYKLDRYELLCPIGSGGMASVWLARMRGKRGFEKLFAIKTIKTELITDPRFQQMFLDEARIASMIQHPNVAQILDLGEQDDILYTVMEWVDGESLAKIHRLALKRGKPLPLGVSLRVMADACAGLHAAHELRDAEGAPLGVVHRDVSPENILVTAGGDVKVIDFGVAKVKSRTRGDTRSGVVKGKVRYMAPEQVNGLALDRRADLWSVGMCLYELVTGELFVDDDIDVLRRLVSQDPTPRMHGLPERLVPVMPVFTRSLVADPASRFEDAAAMGRALHGAMVELGLSSFTREDIAGFLRETLPDCETKRRAQVARAVELGKTAPAGDSAPTLETPDDVAFAPTQVSDPNVKDTAPASGRRVSVPEPAAPPPAASALPQPLARIDPRLRTAWTVAGVALVALAVSLLWSRSPIAVVGPAPPVTVRPVTPPAEPTSTLPNNFEFIDVPVPAKPGPSGGMHAPSGSASASASASGPATSPAGSAQLSDAASGAASAAAPDSAPAVAAAIAPTSDAAPRTSIDTNGASDAASTRPSATAPSVASPAASD